MSEMMRKFHLFDNFFLAVRDAVNNTAQHDTLVMKKALGETQTLRAGRSNA